ncbi:MAG: hypothetical protein ACLP9S_13140 [Syntrophales bacterium]|jgi:hypothetical protein
MAKQLEPEGTIALKELLMSEVIQSEALINLLDRKGIISKEELLEEITPASYSPRIILPHR